MADAQTIRNAFEVMIVAPAVNRDGEGYHPGLARKRAPDSFYIMERLGDSPPRQLKRFRPFGTRRDDRREAPPIYWCDLCGGRMYERNCKIVCPNCGYKRDCSDP